MKTLRVYATPAKQIIPVLCNECTAHCLLCTLRQPLNQWTQAHTLFYYYNAARLKYSAYVESDKIYEQNYALNRSASTVRFKSKIQIPTFIEWTVALDSPSRMNKCHIQKSFKNSTPSSRTNRKLLRALNVNISHFISFQQHLQLFDRNQTI